MKYYKLLILKKNGKVIRLGNKNKDIKEIEKRQINFLNRKKEGLRPFHTYHTLIIQIIPKKRKKVARYPKGTTKSVMTKQYYRRYYGKSRLIKPHKINLGGKIKPKKQ